MSREALGADDPKRWMDFAGTDLRMAKEGLKHGYRLEPLCFHAQQAVEKAFKAILLGRRIAFPKIHDLDKLMDLLPPDLVPPPGVKASALLTKYSEAGRYPHGFEDVTEEDYHHAIKLAQTVFDWVEKVLAGDRRSGTHEPRAAYKAGKSKLKPRKKK